MGSVHVTLSYRYALLAHTVSPEHHYHFSISHIDSATLTDTSLFLHVAIYGASNPLTVQFMLHSAVYFERWVVERNEKNQIDFGIVLFCVLWKEGANTYIMNCFIETALLWS